MSFLSILNLWKHEIKNYLSSWTNNVIITEKYGKLGGFTNDDYQGSSMTKFYGKLLLRASNHVENWPCLAFYVNGNEFRHLGQNLVFFGQNWPFLTLYDKNFKILLKTLTQGLKPCGKVALFGSLGLFLCVWSLGPNLDLLGPKSPKYAGRPQLFIGPLDFTYP